MTVAEQKAVVETTMADLINALHRLSIALEQHTLALLDSHPSVDLSPLPPAYQYEDQGSVAVPQVIPAQAVVAQPQITVAPVAQLCPVHHTPFRQNARGFYCPKKNPDGSWCKQTLAA